MAGLTFELNGEQVAVDDVSPTTTLLRWLRDARGSTGTKEGCAEGDCGACTVVVGDTDLNGDRVWRAVNSCLVLLPSLHGARVVTVEGLSRGKRLHPIQKAVVTELGSQCGYCTPGVVMSGFEAVYRPQMSEADIDDQMCGNLCRCTGYRPIRDAVRSVAGSRPVDPFLKWLDEPPAKTATELDYWFKGQRYLRPINLEGALEAMGEEPDARLICGTTDVGLEVTKRHARPLTLIGLEAVAELKSVVALADGWRIGAGVPLSDLEAWSVDNLPPLARMLRYFGSRQIKHRATLGGNICNASPIGDTPPVLLALNATVLVASSRGERRVPMHQFFLSYRKTALKSGELVVAIEIPDLGEYARVGAYKVSKRRELDISAVAACFYVEVDGDNQVTVARLAYGGMAATPARAKAAEAATVGKPWDPVTVEAAAMALSRDFTPMSDHRGSAWYRETVAANLLRGFYEETLTDPVPVLPSHPSATVLPGGAL